MNDERTRILMTDAVGIAAVLAIGLFIVVGLGGWERSRMQATIEAQRQLSTEITQVSELAALSTEGERKLEQAAAYLEEASSRRSDTGSSAKSLLKFSSMVREAGMDSSSIEPVNSGSADLIDWTQYRLVASGSTTSALRLLTKLADAFPDARTERVVLRLAPDRQTLELETVMNLYEYHAR